MSLSLSSRYPVSVPSCPRPCLRPLAVLSLSLLSCRCLQGHISVTGGHREARKCMGRARGGHRRSRGGAGGHGRVREGARGLTCLFRYRIWLKRARNTGFSAFLARDLGPAGPEWPIGTQKSHLHHQFSGGEAQAAAARHHTLRRLPFPMYTRLTHFMKRQ